MSSAWKRLDALIEAELQEVLTLRFEDQSEAEPERRSGGSHPLRLRIRF
jgi:hypothetical protein